MLKVFVYWNSNRKCWSIKALEGEHKGRVIRHEPYVYMHSVKFKVSQAGRHRVLKEKRKNVHAGIVGYVCSTPMHTYLWNQVQVTYNPHRDENFIRIGTWKPIFEAKGVYLTRNRKAFAYV
jgi:hypothetical protein